MSSQISRQANALSMRTGIPIRNHGMVPVYYPETPAKKWDDRGVFYALQQPPAHSGMSKGYKGALIAGTVMSGLGELLDAIMSFFPKKNAVQPEIKQEEPKNEVKVEDKKVEDKKEEIKPEEIKPKIDNEGDQDKYGLGHDEVSVTKVNVIKYGGPYHYAQLYTYDDGSPIPKGSADFKALTQALKAGENGIQESGNQRVLQNEIELPSGKKVKLMNNPNARIAQGFDDANKGGINLRYQVYQDVTGTWFIYKNGDKNDRVQTFDSEAAARTFAKQQGFKLEE